MNNKMKKSILAMALIPVGVMFMAVSPRATPIPNRSEYTDFSYSLVEKSTPELDEDEPIKTQRVVFDIENTGDFFALFFDITFCDKTSRFSLLDEDRPVYSNGPDFNLLAPLSTDRYVAELRYPSSETFDETSEYTITACAFNEKVDLTVNSVLITYAEMKYPLYHYNVNFDLTYEDDDKNELFIAYTLEYEGKNCNFYTMIKDKPPVASVHSLSALVENEVHNNNVQILRGHKITNLQPFLNAVTTFILICLMAVLALVGVLVVVIVLSVRRDKRKQLTMSDINK